MNKPIEPGCLCLSLQPEFPGECTALQFYPKHEAFMHPSWGRCCFGEDVWEVAFSEMTVYMPAKALIRIDGGEAESIDEDQEVPSHAHA